MLEEERREARAAAARHKLTVERLRRQLLDQQVRWCGGEREASRGKEGVRRFASGWGQRQVSVLTSRCVCGGGGEGGAVNGALSPGAEHKARAARVCEAQRKKAPSALDQWLRSGARVRMRRRRTGSCGRRCAGTRRSGCRAPRPPRPRPPPPRPRRCAPPSSFHRALSQPARSSVAAAAGVLHFVTCAARRRSSAGERAASCCARAPLAQVKTASVGVQAELGAAATLATVRLEAEAGALLSHLPAMAPRAAAARTTTAAGGSVLGAGQGAGSAGGAGRRGGGCAGGGGQHAAHAAAGAAAPTAAAAGGGGGAAGGRRHLAWAWACFRAQAGGLCAGGAAGGRAGRPGSDIAPGLGRGRGSGARGAAGRRPAAAAARRRR